MRIALFTETFLPHTDGIVTRLTQTIEELRRAGDDVLIVAPQAPGLPLNYYGAKVIGLPSISFPLYQDFYLGLPFTNKALRAAVTAFTPDLIHAVNPIMIGWEALYHARRSHVPFVASYHTNIPAYVHRYGLGMLEGLFWWYLRLLHNCAHLNLCTSRFVREQLQAHGIRSVQLWEPGIDTNHFHPQLRSDAWRPRLTGGHPVSTILLYVGRLAAEKGLDRLMAVLPQLESCHIALIGDGPMADALRYAAKGLPVTFLGPLYGKELAAAYASADVFVFPSSTETLGLVAIEAMASGLPVVGARSGGIPDIVVEGETGLLFNPDDLEEFAMSLKYLVTHIDERRQMGQAGRRHAEKWSWASSTAGLRQLYMTLINDVEKPVQSQKLVQAQKA
jgi:glycosyltransferase involved in cell wall biosynthesis